jgi:hypothetical protein
VHGQFVAQSYWARADDGYMQKPKGISLARATFFQSPYFSLFAFRISRKQSAGADITVVALLFPVAGVIKAGVTESQSDKPFDHFIALRVKIT